MIVFSMLSCIALIIFLSGGQGGSSPFVWSTLIGAVVGGTLSLLGTVLVERQRGKGAERKEERGRISEGRLAVRLVGAELRDAETVLGVMLKQSPYKWPPKPGFQFSLAAWEAHAPQLAGVLPNHQWDQVATTYFAFRASNLLVDVNEASANSMRGAASDAIKALDSWLASVQQ